MSNDDAIKVDEQAIECSQEEKRASVSDNTQHAACWCTHCLMG